MSTLDRYKNVIREHVTVERVAAWRPVHEHADFVDYMLDHDCELLLALERHGVPSRDSNRACNLAMRYLRLLRAANRKDSTR